MALVIRDRVKETTATTGTGTYTLSGAVSGFEAFSEIGNSNTTYYGCSDGTNFEVGIGTYTLSGTTLTRTTILESSSTKITALVNAFTRAVIFVLLLSRIVVLVSVVPDKVYVPMPTSKFVPSEQP